MTTNNYDLCYNPYSTSINSIPYNRPASPLLTQKQNNHTQYFLEFENEELAHSLQEEKRVNRDLTNILNSNNYELDIIRNNYENKIEDFNALSAKYHQSEQIRLNQENLISSLEKELESLKEKVKNLEMNENNNKDNETNNKEFNNTTNTKTLNKGKTTTKFAYNKNKTTGNIKNNTTNNTSNTERSTSKNPFIKNLTNTNKTTSSKSKPKISNNTVNKFIKKK